MKSRALLVMALPLILLATGSTPAADEVETGWSDSAELSLVSTSGNSESSTIGFKNTTERRWENAALVIRLGGIRAENDTITRSCVGPDADNCSVRETSESEVTAENYYLNGRYGRNITESFFWYTGLGWARNRPAGIDNRYVAEGGVGNIWNDTNDLKFSTAYALTWTKQEDLVVAPGVDDTFIGARFSWNYLNKFGKATTYENVFILDANLEESSNWRGDMINSVSVTMSERLALKVSLQWLYQNDPALELVDLFDPGDLNTPIGQALVPVDELDSIFTASLVVNF